MLKNIDLQWRDTKHIHQYKTYDPFQEILERMRIKKIIQDADLTSRLKNMDIKEKKL